MIDKGEAGKSPHIPSYGPPCMIWNKLCYHIVDNEGLTVTIKGYKTQGEPWILILSGREIKEGGDKLMNDLG